MRTKMSEKMEIPSGITCTIHNKILTCKKGDKFVSRNIELPRVTITVNGNELVISTHAGARKENNLIKSYLAHIKNIFSGLQKDFTYILEAVNVHFPMTLKLEKNNLLITNFLGEKKPRIAAIHPHVKAEIKGQRIILTSHDKEAVGETVSCIERTTKVRKKDRRVFQDGVYLVERPGRTV
ncbi:MAG: 50S ribosomal protein L6 [Nanoarchaeota archaeon]|nr:50S ribosomal protein L6 [Nanoarchaeota archaeon]